MYGECYRSDFISEKLTCFSDLAKRSTLLEDFSGLVVKLYTSNLLVVHLHMCMYVCMHDDNVPYDLICKINSSVYAVFG